MMTSIFPSLVVGLAVMSVSYGQEDNTKRQEKVIRVFDTEVGFLAAMKSFNMKYVSEDFSKALGDERSVNLNLGRNNIGTFDIIVGAADKNKNITNKGSITGDDGGTYNGVYNDDVTDIKFDYFENATVYAFAATWDIDHPYIETDLQQSLYIRLGSGYNEYVLNLQEYMYNYDTRFIGFIDDFEGFRSVGIFSPESKEEITFKMHSVKLSTSNPNPVRTVSYAMVMFQTFTDSLMNVFNLGGFFGESGFYSDVIIDTLNFFFGSGGVLLRSGGGAGTASTLVERYSQALFNMMIPGDEDDGEE